jgi:hypothetical protein
MTWNVADKGYRHFQLGEDWSRVGRAFAIEAAFDSLLFGVAPVLTKVGYFGGEATKKSGGEIFKITKRAWEMNVTQWLSKNSVARTLSNPLIVHSEQLAPEAARWLRAGVKAFSNKAAKEVTKEIADPAIAAEAVRRMSK